MTVTVTETLTAAAKTKPAAADAKTKTAPAAPGEYTILPGRLGNLTPAQEAALATVSAQLRADGAFVESRHDDASLLRFLRARKFDVPKTMEMLLAAEKWRKDFKVDELVRTFDFKELQEVDKYYPQSYHKTDKSGRPVYIECIGNLNVKALYACTSQERLLQRLVVEYEAFLTTRLPACTAAAGRPIETSLTILDLGGVSLSNFIRVKDYVFAATSIGQNMYPEVLGAFYIVNAPWAFAAVWAAIKPWLDPVTVAKVRIVGGPAAYRPLLLAQIEKESLPREFGGECACVGGCSLSDAGPWNPRGGEAVPTVEDEDEAACEMDPEASVLLEKTGAVVEVLERQVLSA